MTCFFYISDLQQNGSTGRKSGNHKKIKTKILQHTSLSSAEAYMKFLVRERERARSDGKIFVNT
jgi:hypothetical protein